MGTGYLYLRALRLCMGEVCCKRTRHLLSLKNTCLRTLKLQECLYTPIRQSPAFSTLGVNSPDRAPSVQSERLKGWVMFPQVCFVAYCGDNTTGGKGSRILAKNPLCQSLLTNTIRANSQRNENQHCNFFIAFCWLRPFLQPAHCEATQRRKINLAQASLKT